MSPHAAEAPAADSGLDRLVLERKVAAVARVHLAELRCIPGCERRPERLRWHGALGSWLPICPDHADPSAPS